MTASLFASLIAVVHLGTAELAAPAPAPRDIGEQLAQVMFRSRMVMRVETLRVTAVPRTYKEKKGPRCLTATDILGSAILTPKSVDIVLRGGDRVRARFAASCPGLDYYSGFYVVPHADGKICAGRDVVRDRAGGECSIDKVRRLVPDK